MFAKIVNYIKELKEYWNEHWYDPVNDTWWPRCKLCKGKRDENCPPECMGDFDD